MLLDILFRDIVCPADRLLQSSQIRGETLMVHSSTEVSMCAAQHS